MTDDRDVKPLFKAPPLSCDAHFHVFGPADRYPPGGINEKLRYAPPLAPLEDYLAPARPPARSASSASSSFSPAPMAATIAACSTPCAPCQAVAASSILLSEATSLPVITTARAMVNALQHDKAQRVAVVTPYSDIINTQLVAFLASGDIGVVRLNSFRAPDVATLGRITAEQVRDLARATMGSDCDALFIGCSQLPTHAILAGLEAEFARPAWSSIRATAWDAKRLHVLH